MELGPRCMTHEDVFVLIWKLDLEVAGGCQHRLDCPHPIVIVKLAGELQREERSCTTRGSPRGGIYWHPMHQVVPVQSTVGRW